MQPNSIDVDKLLRFFRRVYVHALTMQEMIEHADDPEMAGDYEVLAERNRRIVEEQLEIFFTVLHAPTEKPQTNSVTVSLISTG